MIDDIVGSNGSRFIIAVGAVALGLLCLVAVLWFIRNRPSSPFIRGGKNRQPRLAVLDAAAVDTRRRLVLVRRDDVEHLIMIGGPTDIVIESRIGASAPTPAPVSAAAPVTVETSIPATRAVPERRPPVSQPEQRPQPIVQQTPPQVSAMGSVLYGENFDTPSQPVARAAQPAPQRPRVETPVTRPMPTAERPAQPAPIQRPQATTTAAPELSVQHARTPEDILDAARNRVLSTGQSAPQQAPLASPTPERTPVADFESILDAEISGDLSRLSVGGDMRVDSEVKGSSAAAARQDPRFSPGQRAEPTLEEEMNRMLGEMSAGEKR
ncbi:hypothetical protein QO002_002647 [Pararhizobium capsulatum DSM 1112]|uniref:Flagellar biosynthesis protein, FliO n=1 Tax=Pararhizobium capsulatum DSM 1112 TaxID=1121113 RepID=A0ABU0BQI4_9HYPH|nr:flagellar biosynthetic protein FliO [Pararhizobium capsulatum]MDQ0320509.1 hypothetical protein [Pararhizobium capsulatum DSM 1112]